MRSASLSDPPALDLPDREQGRIVREFTVMTLTPIYKGGANPTGIDRDRPFRGSSLRGQLRFWWRATRDETAVDRLRQAERALWGGVIKKTVIASRVRVGFTQQSSRRAEQPEGTNYVLWPHELNKDRKSEDAESFHAAGATARLTVGFPADDDVAAAVDDALSAWLLLGGMGGRTRRGLGKVWHEGYTKLPRHFDSVDAWVARLAELAPSPGAREWPSLAGARVVVGPPQRDAMAAWKQSIDMMQSVRISDEDAQPLPGVPRPAALQSDFPTLVNGQPFVSARAALGLPIQFRTNHGKIVMGPTKHNRFPSPVFFAFVPLLRKVAPAFVALTTPFPDQNEQIEAKRDKIKGRWASGQLEPAGVRLFMEAAAQGWKSTVHTLGGTP